MKVTPVNNISTAKAFIQMPHFIYKNDEQWICPLDSDIEAIFDEKLNSFHRHGKCQRWILQQGNQTIGRIAAFINEEKAYKSELPTGGVGFFECINNKDAAFLLFDTAKAWLQSQGMKAMLGPINFGENDKYWGLLVEGFKPPSYGMNYNPPYYISFFEEYGFVKEYDQLTNYLDLTVPFTNRFTKIAEWVMKKPGYTFEPLDIARYEKYASDFREIYNDAWLNFENFTPIEPAVINESFRQMKAIINPKFIWFAYYNNEPVAFLLCLPDINQILKHVHGKLDLIGKLKYLWYKTFAKIDRLRIIVMGCKQQFQNHGLESALIRKVQLEVAKYKHIKGVELAWVGDFNDKMLAIHTATGATKDKVHRTYVCKF